MPYLADAQSNLFCDIESVIPYATHSIVVGRVVAARVEEGVFGKPLFLRAFSGPTVSILHRKYDNPKPVLELLTPAPQSRRSSFD